MLLIAAGISSGDCSWGQDRSRVAGRTVADYQAEIESDDRVVRLRALKSLGAFGPRAAAAIRGALEHDDPAMRYTAAVQLGSMGGEPLEESLDTLQRLAAEDRSHGVRMAASYALCAEGRLEAHLPMLIESLEYPERGMACSAAELLSQLGGDAVDAVPALQAAYEKHRPGAKGGDYHIGGAAMNALRKIRGE